jgi:hypothetical protein
MQRVAVRRRTADRHLGNRAAEDFGDLGIVSER